MRKKNITTLLIIISGAILLTGVLFANRNDSPSTKAGSTSFQEKWEIYESSALGISVRVPEKVLGEASCKVENNKVILSPGMIQVKVFEDSNNIYVGPEYYYEESGYFAPEAECVKIVFDPVKTLKELNSASSFIPYTGLHISVHSDIKTENEINKFIQERVDSTCRAEEKRPYLDFENIEYIILGDDTSLSTRFACPTHIQPYQLLYDRTKGRIVWSSGVAEKLKDEFGNDVSSDISSSVEFLP